MQVTFEVLHRLMQLGDKGASQALWQWSRMFEATPCWDNGDMMMWIECHYQPETGVYSVMRMCAHVSDAVPLTKVKSLAPAYGLCKHSQIQATSARSGGGLVLAGFPRQGPPLTLEERQAVICPGCSQTELQSIQEGDRFFCARCGACHCHACLRDTLWIDVILEDHIPFDLNRPLPRFPLEMDFDLQSDPTQEHYEEPTQWYFPEEGPTFLYYPEEGPTSHYCRAV